MGREKRPVQAPGWAAGTALRHRRAGRYVLGSADHVAAGSMAAAAAARPAPPPAKSRHKTIIEMIENEDKNDRLELRITTHREPPPEFQFVPIGNPELTRLCKSMSKERGMVIYIVSTSSHPSVTRIALHISRIGHHVHESIIRGAQAMLGQRPGPGPNPPSGPTGAPEPIPESQAEINSQADAAIRDLFPRIPNPDRQMIIDHAFRKGSTFRGAPLVGNAADLSLPLRVQLAVLAHIRHVHTPYDDLWRRTTWMHARRVVQPMCLDILVKWRGDEENGRQDLDFILREIVVISDDEDGEVGDDNVDDTEDDDDDKNDRDGDGDVEVSPATRAPFMIPGLTLLAQSMTGQQEAPPSSSPPLRRPRPVQDEHVPPLPPRPLPLAPPRPPPPDPDRPHLSLPARPLASFPRSGEKRKHMAVADKIPQRECKRYQAAWDQAVSRRREEERTNGAPLPKPAGAPSPPLAPSVPCTRSYEPHPQSIHPAAQQDDGRVRPAHFSLMIPGPPAPERHPPPPEHVGWRDGRRPAERRSTSAASSNPPPPPVPSLYEQQQPQQQQKETQQQVRPGMAAPATQDRPWQQQHRGPSLPPLPPAHHHPYRDLLVPSIESPSPSAVTPASLCGSSSYGSPAFGSQAHDSRVSAYSPSSLGTGPSPAAAAREYPQYQSSPQYYHHQQQQPQQPRQPQQPQQQQQQQQQQPRQRALADHTTMVGMLSCGYKIPQPQPPRAAADVHAQGRVHPSPNHANHDTSTRHVPVPALVTTSAATSAAVPFPGPIGHPSDPPPSSQRITQPGRGHSGPTLSFRDQQQQQPQHHQPQHQRQQRQQFQLQQRQQQQQQHYHHHNQSGPTDEYGARDRAAAKDPRYLERGQSDPECEPQSDPRRGFAPSDGRGQHIEWRPQNGAETVYYPAPAPTLPQANRQPRHIPEHHPALVRPPVMAMDQPSLNHGPNQPRPEPAPSQAPYQHPPPQPRDSNPFEPRRQGEDTMPNWRPRRQSSPLPIYPNPGPHRYRSPTYEPSQVSTSVGDWPSQIPEAQDGRFGHRYPPAPKPARIPPPLSEEERRYREDLLKHGVIVLD